MGDPVGVRYGARMSSIHELSMPTITGEQVDFGRFRGQVLLVVNVASA
jgi:glutathione peroxidase-family protein